MRSPCKSDTFVRSPKPQSNASCALRACLGDDLDDFRHLRYTYEEDALLLRLRNQEYLTWAEIEDRMPGTGQVLDSKPI